MQYRIIEEKDVIFEFIYYPQYSEDGESWRYFFHFASEGAEHFRSLEQAKNFIKERKEDNLPKVVWEDED